MGDCSAALVTTEQRGKRLGDCFAAKNTRLAMTAGKPFAAKNRRLAMTAGKPFAARNMRLAVTAGRLDTAPQPTYTNHTPLLR
jgi:hypothetical protein